MKSDPNNSANSGLLVSVAHGFDSDFRLHLKKNALNVDLTNSFIQHVGGTISTTNSAFEFIEIKGKADNSKIATPRFYITVKDHSAGNNLRFFILDIPFLNVFNWTEVTLPIKTAANSQYSFGSARWKTLKRSQGNNYIFLMVSDKDVASPEGYLVMSSNNGATWTKCLGEYSESFTDFAVLIPYP